MKLETYEKIVDRSIEKMGMNLKEYKVADNQWVYIKGSAFTLVEIGNYMHEGKERGYIQAFAPICMLPSNKETFMNEVLKYNHQLRGAFFGLYRDIVVLKVIRDLVGLDDSEVENMITYLGKMADKLDNPIIKIHAAQRVDVTMSLLREIANIKPMEA
ncbi:MAG: YbjN domain-containing protein [Bacteroidetes bacterium]|nr:YbjN domain-containing protein [Bacteroidota bacterium]